MELVYLCTALGIGILTFINVLKRVNGWYYLLKLSPEESRLPPGDMGWPFVGNMLFLLKCYVGGNLDAFAAYFSTRFGPGGMYTGHMFGRPSIIVTTPETCRKILMDEENFAVAFPDYMLNLLGNQENQEHKILRRTAANAIKTHGSLSYYFDSVNKIVKGSFDKWLATDEPLELLSEMKRPAFEVLMQVLVGGEDGVSREVLDYVFKENQHRFKAYKSLAVNIPGFAFYRGVKARKAVGRMLQDVINQRKVMIANKQGRPKSMLDAMLDTQDEHGNGFSDEDIIKVLLSYTFGGYEIVALVAIKTIMHLEKHPELLQKAKEEQEEIVNRRPSPDAGLTFDEIGQMKYLSNVYHETLRFGSTETIFFRIAKTTVNINGYTIPKGWKVLTTSGHWYMDPNTYVKPKEFNPSRWDDAEIKPTSFLPLGVGPRMCPGANLAKLTNLVVGHYFLLNYRLEQVKPPSKGEPPENCLVRFKKISA
ncbi:beta-amyrin 11-oxidase-like [Lycium barbarum]|uniref:beta-amyrin 11-oxidase-like n=1 Tax=Lycium barbarum TaxID=112863 RepID=UPI00293EE88C|nr:beta-amyrin 11-oxidase-like [Lycium barbarum]